MRSRYMFYLERIHIARLPVVVERRRDPIWYAGMVINVGFFGGMALWCIATPHAAISLQDGQCRIGSGMIPSYITFSFDVIINVFCTGIFIWLILPMMRNPARGIQASDPPVRNSYSTTGVLGSSVDRDDKLTLSVKRMLKRNIIGSALTFAASAINLVVYFVDATSQIAYVCYTLCIIDGMCLPLIIKNLVLTERQWSSGSWSSNGLRLDPTRRTKYHAKRLLPTISLAQQLHFPVSLCLRLSTLNTSHHRYDVNIP